MKYIKKYENQEDILADTLKVDDYILVNISDVDNKKLPKDSIIQPVKYIVRNTNDFPFLCKFKNGIKFGLHENEIIRKLTTKEIENFEINLIANKYNL